MCTESLRNLEKSYLKYEACLDTTRTEFRDFFYRGGREDLIHRCLQVHQEVCNNLRQALAILENESNGWGRHKNAQMKRRNFTRNMENVMKICSKAMGHITRNIVQMSHSVIGEVGAKFEVAGLCSLAHRDMTPFSEVKLIIIVEEDCHEDAKRRLQQLAILTYFIIGNLGQTNLNDMDIPELTQFNFKDRSLGGYRAGSLAPNVKDCVLIVSPKELYRLWETELMTADNSRMSDDHSDLLTSGCVFYRYDNDEGIHLMKQFGAMLPQNKEKLFPGYFQTRLLRLQDILTKYKDFPTPNQERGCPRTAWWQLTSELVFNLKRALQIRGPYAAEIVKQLKISPDSKHALRLLLAIGNFIPLDAHLKYKIHRSNDAILSPPSHGHLDSDLPPCLDIYTVPESLYQTCCYLLSQLKTYLFSQMLHKTLTKSELASIFGSGLVLHWADGYYRARSYYFQQKYHSAVAIIKRELDAQTPKLHVSRPEEFLQYMRQYFNDDKASFEGMAILAESLDRAELYWLSVRYYITMLSEIGRRKPDGNSLSLAEVQVMGCLSNVLLKMRRLQEPYGLQKFALVNITLLETGLHLDLRKEKARALLTLGNIYHCAVMYNEALKHYADAIMICEELQTENSIETKQKCLVGKTATLLALNRLTEAQETCITCMDLCCETQNPCSDTEIARTLDLMAQLSIKRAEYPRARQIMQMALSIREGLHGMNRELGIGYQNLAAVLYHLTGDSGAEAHLVKAISKFYKIKGEVLDVYVAECHTALGALHLQRGHCQNAVVSLLEAKMIYGKKCMETLKAAVCLLYLGAAYYGTDQLSEATDSLQDGLRMLRAFPSELSGHLVAMGYVLTAEIEAKLGQTDNALINVRVGIDQLHSYRDLPKAYLDILLYAYRLHISILPVVTENKIDKLYLKEAIELGEKVS